MRSAEGWPVGPDVGRLYPSARAAAPVAPRLYAERPHPTHTLSRIQSLRSWALKPSPTGRGMATPSGSSGLEGLHHDALGEQLGQDARLR